MPDLLANLGAMFATPPTTTRTRTMSTPTTRTLIIAPTIPAARALAQHHAAPALLASPRTLKAGALRGLVGISSVTVDAALWPLPDHLLNEIAPSLA